VLKAEVVASSRRSHVVVEGGILGLPGVRALLEAAKGLLGGHSVTMADARNRAPLTETMQS
jgi:hypothetical protein